MNQPVVSQFSLAVYVKVIGIAIAVIAIIGVVIYNDDTIDHGNRDGQAVTAALCLVLVCIGLLAFITTCIKVIVSPENIIVSYPLFIPPRIIPFADVRSANTYRRRWRNRPGDGLDNFQNLVIEYNNAKNITLYAPNFDNYSDLKAAIYKYKYGIE